MAYNQAIQGDLLVTLYCHLVPCVMGLRSTCFTFFFKTTFQVDYSFYRHANYLRKSLQRGRKLKANDSC